MLGLIREVVGRWGSWVAVALLLTPVLAVGAVSAANVQVETDPNSPVYAGEFVVPLNKSQILRIDTAVKEILVGNSEIADVLALTDQSIYVLGLQVGSTNLTVYGEGRRLLAVMDLVVSYDIEALKTKLHEMMPAETVEVRTVNGAVMLSGVISNKTRLCQTLAIAERFAPGAVGNSLSVKGSQQVLLEVRFAEVQRTLARSMGINHNVLFDDGTTVLRLLTGATSAFGVPAFATAGIGHTSGNFDTESVINFLEGKGLIRILAEPNLVALSGDTASFLAGGEFPIPVPQVGGGAAVTTVEFKPFGVSLSFTPTVIGDDLINLVVEPEVSSISNTLSVNLGVGSDVPGLNTRRVHTTIEIRDGQSFTIAGLLQSDYENDIKQFPWLGDIPVLGALFRSSDFRRNETELVVIVTPRLVAPAPSPAVLALPVDTVVPPSDVELFLLGMNEGATSGARMAGGEAGGIAGQYGHIIK